MHIIRNNHAYNHHEAIMHIINTMRQSCKATKLSLHAYKYGHLAFHYKLLLFIPIHIIYTDTMVDNWSCLARHILYLHGGKPTPTTHSM